MVSTFLICQRTYEQAGMHVLCARADRLYTCTLLNAIRGTDP